MDVATKTGLDTLKTASKKITYKAVEVTGESIGNTTANKVVKPSRNVEEIIIPPKKREEILNELNIIKMEQYKT